LSAADGAEVGPGGSRFGEPALERLHGRRLRSVGGDTDNAELPDDEEQQQHAGGDGQLSDDTENSPGDPHARASAARGAVEVDGAGVRGELAGVARRDVVAQPDGVDPLAVDAHLRVSVEGGPEFAGVADRPYDVGR
jgi:hypothetical protein